jgi:hypothetical protein
MTELALVCLFIYAPVLMMVIVWGDMSLDKERAHAAAAAMAFEHAPMSDGDLVAQFFPTATGAADGTHSVRTVAVVEDRAEEGPVYALPNSGQADYAGGEPPLYDLQYKLYSLGVGEVHVTIEMQWLPDGSPGFVMNVQRIQDDVAHYLTKNQIVRVGGWPTGPIQQPLDGGALQFDTGTSSTDYTHYVATLTDVFNGRWDAGGMPAGGVMGNAHPMLESRAELRTTFRSPFLSELESGTFGPHEAPDLNLPRVQGEPGFEMLFGPGDQVGPDDSFRTGYTFLPNPKAVSDGRYLRDDLYELSDTIFDRNGRRIHEMPNPLSTGLPGHQAFLTPGDPRGL